MKLLFVSLFATLLANTFVVAIHNGRPVKDIRQVPYMVSIHYNNELTCGGAIISNYWILTAAHCVSQNIIVPSSTEKIAVDRNVDSLAVRTGTSKYNDDRARLAVESVTRRQPVGNVYPDIALIKLKTPISFNDYQKSIPIACGANGRPRVEDNVTISGFGTNEIGGNSDYLQQIDTTITDVYDDSFDTYDSNMVTKVGAGDSGSPVVYDGVVIGVVQRGSNNKLYADLHTIVDIHANWISAVTQSQAQEKCIHL